MGDIEDGYKYDNGSLSPEHYQKGYILKNKIEVDDKMYHYLLEVDTNKVAKMLDLPFSSSGDKDKVYDLVEAVTKSIWRQKSWMTRK